MSVQSQPPEGRPHSPRVIKRYANRKLYDTEHSRYVTLDQISEMIRNGDDVKIVDNKTKEDLTTVTLAQIIFEEEKKQRSFLPLGAMRNIIQNGSEWFAEAQRRVQDRVQSILPGKRKDGEEEGDDGQDAGADVAEEVGQEPEGAGRGRRRLGVFLVQMAGQQTTDQVQEDPEHQERDRGQDVRVQRVAEILVLQPRQVLEDVVLRQRGVIDLHRHADSVGKKCPASRPLI